MTGQEYRFYRYLTRPADKELEISLPEGYEIRLFIPKFPRIVPPNLTRGLRHNFCSWWAMRVLGVFSRSEEYKVYTVYNAEDFAHYTVVVPRHFKFPFMGDNDIQANPVYTAPEHRRKGLAHAVIVQIKKDYAESGGCLWYVVRPENLPSIAHIEKLGFELYAIGAKAKRLGLSFLGRYEIGSLLK